jgi:hypothetical protein
VAPLALAVLEAETDEAREVAARALEALGVGAVPALLAESEAAEEPRKAALKRFAARQASIVTAIEVTEDSVEPDAPFQALLDGLRDRPFDGDAYVALMLHATRTTPEGATGLRVRASRLDDLTGVTLRVTLLSRRHDDGNTGGWTYSTPRGGWGTMVHSRGLEEEAWREEADDVDDAFRGPARSEAVVMFHVVREVDR